MMLLATPVMSSPLLVFIRLDVEQVRKEFFVYAAAQVSAAEIIDSPEPPLPSTPSFPPPVVCAVVIVAFECRRRSRPVAGVEQLEVREDVEGSEQLPDANAAGLHGLHARQIVQDLGVVQRKELDDREVSGDTAIQTRVQSKTYRKTDR